MAVQGAASRLGDVLLPSLLAGLIALQLAGCSPVGVADEQVPNGQVAVSASPRFSPAAIVAMKKQLLAEPKIKDLLFSDDRYSVTWQIGVLDDGSRRIGYAGYVCMLLADKNLVDQDTDVRIVDVVALERSGGDFRGASLGHVRCRDGADQGV